MSHDETTAATRSPQGRDVARTARSVRSNHPPERRGNPVAGSGRKGAGRAGQRPRRAAASRRFSEHWSIRDRIGATVAGTGAGAVLTTMVLAATGAPTAAYGAIGAVGAGATAAIGIYLGKK